MSVNLPSFDPGSEGTLLDSANAKQVKAFCEAFNDVQIVQGDENSFNISDKNVVLSINPSQLGGGTTEGAAVDVVQSDGKLISVTKRSDATTPTNYPTVLKVVNGSNSITLDSTGITMTNGSHTLTISFSALTADMSIRADDYCDGTVAKTQRHIASVPA